MTETEVSTCVLNGHIGTNNIINQEALDTTMMKTFKEIGSILEDHCGPYGQYAIINDLLQPTVEPVFTKDGINIVRSIKYVSPMEEFCRKMVAYVGSRVESDAGDGTTTAMLLTIKAMAYLFNRKDRSSSYRIINKQYDKFLEIYNTKLQSQIMTVHDVLQCLRTDDPSIKKQEAISTIAYHQAYTSSHGDEELAEAVAKMFLYTPEEVWDYICFEKEGFETQDRIKFEVDENQFSSKVNVFQKNMLNHDLGTRYEGIVELLTIVEDLTLDSLVYSMLLSKITEVSNNPSVNPLCIVCSSNMCQQTRAGLEEVLKLDINNKIVIFEHRPEDPSLNDLIVLNLLVGIPLAIPIRDGSFMTTKDVKCSYQHGKLQLNNLYDNPSGSNIYPHLKNESSDGMRYMLNHIKGILENLKNGTVSRASHLDIIRFRKLYNKIFLTKRGVIRVGGSAHDNISTIDVITDVVQAVRNSLKHGFVLANNVSMFDILLNIQDDTDVTMFTEAFLKSIVTVREAVYKCSPYENNLPDTVISDDVLTGSERRMMVAKDWLTTTEGGMIIQPSTIDIQILKRFGEVALKFLCSNKVISPGGYYLKEEAKDK